MQTNEPENLQLHRKHLVDSLTLLMSRQYDWTGDDITRGEATKENLLQQIDEIDRRGRK